MARRLLSWGAELSYHDPFVREWSIAAGGHGVPLRDSVSLKSVDDVYEACEAADIVVLLQPHNHYDLRRLADVSPLILDTRGVVPLLANTLHL